MNLSEVQRTLMDMYARSLDNGKQRHIVFWYDEAGEFQEEIPNLGLDNVHVLEITTNNLFAAKYEIEKVRPTEHFLIYGAMAKPSPREDWLLDTYKYSFEFATDKVTVIMRDLGIEDDSLRPTFQNYIKFFNSRERYQLFASYKMDTFTKEAIDVAVLSALCKCPYPNLEQALQVLFSEERSEKNKHWEKIVKFGDEETFWTIMEKVYGYQQTKRSLKDLFTFLCISHLSESMKEDLPSTWKSYVAHNSTNSIVFINHFMNEEEIYNQLADEVVQTIHLEKYIKEWDIHSLVDCDTFRSFDLQIIEKISGDLVNGIENYESYKGIINNRRKSHWYDTYKHELNALYWAIVFFEKGKEFEEANLHGNAEDIFKQYCETYYLIDQAYRKFFVSLDRTIQGEQLHGLGEYVENTYSNWYLKELSVKWSKALEENSHQQWELPGLSQQYQFYKDHVRSLVSKGERIFVIISDALRYEAAKELADQLNIERKNSIEFEAMQSVLPSYTDLGMAALLPYKELSYMTDSVYIDGMRASSTENRNAILNKYVGAEEAVAIQYKELMNFNRQQYREKFTGKKLVYIYHNTIDAHGDHAATEHRVFEAVDDTIKELRQVVSSLIHNISASNIYITADHGFLYQRNQLENHEKLIKASCETIIDNRRFLLTEQKEEIQGTLTFSLDYVLGADSDKYVIVPRGSERFAKQGAGANYVHGGAMPQEIVVPLIKYKTDRSKNSKNEVKKVDIQLTSLTRKITNNITYLDFFQTEIVEDKKLPIHLKVYIADEEGNRVSNENIIIGDRRSTNPEDRTFKEKFVLKSMTYDKTKQYYLILEDEEESVEKIYQRYPFTIDISFTNDFGF